VVADERMMVLLIRAAEGDRCGKLVCLGFDAEAGIKWMNKLGVEDTNGDNETRDRSSSDSTLVDVALAIGGDRKGKQRVEAIGNGMYVEAAMLDDDSGDDLELGDCDELINDDSFWEREMVV
jgi:hypothetical protein